MSRNAIVLPEVDEAKVQIVVDNSLDLLMSGSDVAHRFPMGRDSFERQLPIAEHGFSALIQVRMGKKSGTVLFDTALTPKCLMNNLDALEIDVKTIQAIVLSHGHADHTMGLPGLDGRLGMRNLPLVLHPDAYLERRIVLPNGNEIGLPAPRLADYRQENIETIEEEGPSMLVDSMVLISGQVPRITEFENGLPGHQSRRNGGWKPDPLIVDDQSAIINVRGKGLVILTGCGHAGIINIIRHAQTLTGVQSIHAVIGGFHLTGALFAPIIPPTVAALEKIKPRYLMPGHCTGWSAMHHIAHAMPEAFLPNSVGTTYILGQD